MSDTYSLAQRAGELLRARGMLLATAESCTGGWVGEAITGVAGSSQWYERGFIAYANIAKIEMLGVREETLEKHGAVSEETVREMATGALRHSHAHVVLAVSGIAGPSGGTTERPVGTVCFAWGTREGSLLSETRHFAGDRATVREQAVEAALQGLLEMLAAQGKF